MPTWADIEREVPDFARAVQAVFDAHKHKTMATLRADGSPRISGTEAPIRDGELWLGSMPGSRKAEDLLRDPRVAIHSATVDPEMTLGDAKVAGRAVRVTDPAVYARFLAEHAEENDEVPEDDFPLFTLDVQEISLVRVGDPADHLVIESWNPSAGYRRVQRT